MNKKGGGSAFPLYCPQTDGMQESIISGMTLHQWYAGMALQGMVAAHKHMDDFWRGKNAKNKGADYCLEFADAMLKAYKKREENENK